MHRPDYWTAPQFPAEGFVNQRGPSPEGPFSERGGLYDSALFAHRWCFSFAFHFCVARANWSALACDAGSKPGDARSKSRHAVQNPATPAQNPATPAQNPATPIQNPATPAPNLPTTPQNPATPAPNPVDSASKPCDPCPESGDTATKSRDTTTKSRDTTTKSRCAGPKSGHPAAKPCGTADESCNSLSIAKNRALKTPRRRVDRGRPSNTPRQSSRGRRSRPERLLNP